MAKATLRSDPEPSPRTGLTLDSPEACLAAVRRLYARLQRLPTADHPGAERRGRSGSLAYQAIEQQIKQYAERYMTAVHAELDALQVRAEEEARQAARLDEGRRPKPVPRVDQSRVTAVPCDPTTTTYEPKPLTWHDDAARRARRVKGALKVQEDSETLPTAPW